MDAMKGLCQIAGTTNGLIIRSSVLTCGFAEAKGFGGGLQLGSLGGGGFEVGGGFTVGFT